MSFRSFTLLLYLTKLLISVLISYIFSYIIYKKINLQTLDFTAFFKILKRNDPYDQDINR